MARQLEFTGKSGALYRYTLLEDGPPMWPSGGNYLFVRPGERRPEIVFAGETESLFRGFQAGWERAQAQYGASEIYVRLNVSGSVRRAEQVDLVARHKPPMNIAEQIATPKPKPPRKAPARKAPARKPRKAAGG